MQGPTWQQQSFNYRQKLIGFDPFVLFFWVTKDLSSYWGIKILIQCMNQVNGCFIDVRIQ